MLRNFWRAILFVNTSWFCFWLHEQSLASAWLQKANRLEVINNLVFTENHSLLFARQDFINNSSRLINQLYGFSYNLYAEYGLTAKNTLGVNFLFSLYNLVQKDGSVYNSNLSYGLQFVELFYRREIVQLKNFILSFEITNKSPSVYNQNSPLSSTIFQLQNQNDIQFQFNIGWSDSDQQTGIFGADGTKGVFVSAFLAYRYRFSLPFNELSFGLSVGVHINRIVTIIFELMKIITIHTEAEVATLSSYHIVKGTLYFIGKISEETSIVTGVIMDIIGIQTTNPNIPVLQGAGGVLLGVWQKF